MRVTPSLPQRGWQPKMSIPLTSYLHFPMSKENFLLTSRRLLHFWMHQRGRRQTLPQFKRALYHFPIISTMPKFYIKFFDPGKKRIYINAAVIPITPDWIMTATAMMTPPIISATATLPFLISSNSSIPLVSLSRI